MREIQVKDVTARVSLLQKCLIGFLSHAILTGSY